MNWNMKTYSECYEIIATYDHEDLPLFADGWSRFPAYPNAAIIVENLTRIAGRSYMPADKAELIRSVATTITDRANA